MHGPHAERQNAPLDDESGRVINDEISRLPDRFRSAIVLCYLEGLTHEMAADQLGCPVGTVRSRLATARDRLRRRLTRRGLAPVDEPPLASLSVPAALIDSTVRGALHVGLGKAALAGIVSTEAVALTDGIAKALGATKLVWAATALVAAIIVAGLGVSTYSAKWRNGNPAPDQVADAKPTDPQAAPNIVQTLLRDSDAAARTFWTAEQQAKTPEQRQTLVLEHEKKLDSYTQALFQIAENNRGTPLAAQALVGIVMHSRSSTATERAIEMITRDHITSEAIEPLFQRSGLFVSQAVEKLYRQALATNPHRQIQGRACYSLARYLDVQTSFFVYRLREKLPLAETTESAMTKTAAGIEDAQERLRKLGPGALDDEATALYERAVKEFGDIPSGEPLPYLTEYELPHARLATLGEIAQVYLNDHKILGVGKPAPEIDGVDLDDRPMKLSDYRGKVVVLYFGGPVPASADPANRAATTTQELQEVGQRHAQDPFALLGVSTFNPGHNAGREAYQASLKARAMPARFWWDLDQFNRPGRIQTAWNARGQIDVYVIDHRGLIRDKHHYGQESLEKTVTMLLNERKDELKRSQANK
jgi:hypothetical protein